jgi:hypothetical protein
MARFQYFDLKPDCVVNFFGHQSLEYKNRELAVLLPHPFGTAPEHCLLALLSAIRKGRTL